MDYKGFSADELRDAFSYNPLTGVIIRKTNPRTGPRVAGSIAGAVAGNGYVVVKYMKEKLLGHRIAWVVHNGGIGEGQIDHINGDRADNRIENLRLVTAAGNSRNRCKSSRNTSGHTGVSWDKKSGKWHARISEPDGSRLSLGVYDNFNEAVNVRKKAERELGYHENHGRGA